MLVCDPLEAEILLSKSFWSFLKSWPVINDLRRVAKAGLPHASQVITKENSDWAQTDAIRKIFHGQDTESLWAAQTDACLNNFAYAIDAASLVFAHSVVDATVLDYCCVIAYMAPDDVINLLKEHKKPKKNQINDESISQKVLRDAVSRVPMPDKTDGICTLCGTEPVWAFADMQGAYTYSLVRLKKLDKLRHEIVHNSDPAIDLSNIDSDIFYLNMTLIYLLDMIKQRYGIVINPIHTLVR